MKSIFFSLLLFFIWTSADARIRTPEEIKKATELQVRNLVEPLLEKYCGDQCKILTIDAQLERSIPADEFPGFEEAPSALREMTPSSVKVKILIDEMFGPVSRKKLLDVVQQHVDALNYSVQIDPKISKFPQPADASRRITELRATLEKQVRNSLNDIFSRFCQGRCVMGDLQIKTDPVNSEEAQYGASGEYLQDGDIAIRIQSITGSVLMDDSLSKDEQANIADIIKLRTNLFKNVDIQTKSIAFPKQLLQHLASEHGADSDYTQWLRQKEINEAKNSSQRTNSVDRKEIFEKIENGDELQKEMKKFKTVFAIGSGLLGALLLFAIFVLFTNRGKRLRDPLLSEHPLASGKANKDATSSDSLASQSSTSLVVAKRYQIQNFVDDLTKIFVENPKVAKQVFSRILTEEGVEITAQYIDIFGEAIVMDMLRDASLQRDLTDLMEFYARNTFNPSDDERLELLRALHNRTIAAKLFVMGNRSTNLFDFVAEMDALQIQDLIRNESLTVKAIIMTQVDPQKRNLLYSRIDDDLKMKILTELSRIDHLPRNYISNVAQALKRKRTENPRLNTEALPGSEVLVGLLERSDLESQRNVLRSLEATNPDASRAVLSKIVSLETLRFVRDNQLLEIILSLKHDELLQFLKNVGGAIRDTIFAKCPKELAMELREEIATLPPTNRDVYLTIERKMINRIKVMANDGVLNLLETNERMFQSQSPKPMEPAIPTSIRRIA